MKSQHYFQIGVPLRNKSCSHTIVQPDLGTVGGYHRGKIGVSGQKKIPVD